MATATDRCSRVPVQLQALRRRRRAAVALHLAGGFGYHRILTSLLRRHGYVAIGAREVAETTGTDGSSHAVLVKGVKRSFGGAEALRGVDFTAEAGEVTGMVGPNGAGKTTLLLILATLLAPDQGVVRLGGHDPL
jgi:ABC-type multidrug transport system fused ATPase/permease subunit